jgi:hypothetical protein
LGGRVGGDRWGAGKPDGRRDAAKFTLLENHLAPVYNWFTEHLDTADLMDARALLDDLK